MASAKSTDTAFSVSVMTGISSGLYLSQNSLLAVQYAEGTPSVVLSVARIYLILLYRNQRAYNTSKNTISENEVPK